jgi:iron complex transport system ATP-binding protein
MSALELCGVSVALGGRTVVDDVSLSVAGGQWAALVGANGSGKTTTLRAVAGFVRHGGRVLVSGVDSAGLRRRERARLIAVVPQIPTTPPDMIVRDYVLLGRTPYTGYFGGESRGDRAATERAISRLDLEAFASRPLGWLSGGERQRVVLARALAQEVGILLLDEPTSALDLARQQRVLELVDGLRREDGLAVLAAMHDLTAVSLYADEVHLLGGGRLVASGDAREVLRADVLTEHYGAAIRVLEDDGELVVVPARPRARA